MGKEKERMRNLKVAFIWTCSVCCSHTPSQEQEQCGFSGKNTSDSGNTKPRLSSHKPNSVSTSPHSSHSSTSWQNTWTNCTYSRHGDYTVSSLWRTQGDSFTYMVNEETLAFFSHCENKRCNRSVTCLHANPLQVAEDGASDVTAPSFHQPMPPDAPLPYLRLQELHKWGYKLG